MFEEWSLQHKRIQDIIKRTTLLRRNVAGMSKSALEIKALFLAANPKTTSQLAVDEEMRAIEQKLRASVSSVEINGAYLPVSDGVCRD